MGVMLRVKFIKWRLGWQIVLAAHLTTYVRVAYRLHVFFLHLFHRRHRRHHRHPTLLCAHEIYSIIQILFRFGARSAQRLITSTKYTILFRRLTLASVEDC